MTKGPLSWSPFLRFWVPFYLSIIYYFCFWAGKPGPRQRSFDFTFFLLGLHCLERCSGLFGQTMPGCFHVVSSGLSILTVISNTPPLSFGAFDRSKVGVNQGGAQTHK